MSVDVHGPVQFPFKRLAKNHELLKQEHLTPARFAGLRVSHHQRVLKQDCHKFNVRKKRKKKRSGFQNVSGAKAPSRSAAMLSLRRIKSFVFARQASARREFSARLAVQKQSFLFS